MAHTKTQAGFRVGQVVLYQGQRVRIKGFPNRFTALIVHDSTVGASGTWFVKTVALDAIVAVN